MKRKIISLSLLIGIFGLFSSCGSSTKDATISDVYFTESITAEGMNKVFATIEKELHGKIGVKVHFGQPGNEYYVKPPLFEAIVKKINGTFVETNVLYNGDRHLTESHIQVAKDHGFTYAPIDILDSEGEIVVTDVEGAKHYKEFFLGSHLNNYDSYLILSHFKGHGSAGFGGAIKNLSMGFATPHGKLAQHKNNIPVVNDKCIGCGICLAECPNGAITLDPLTVDLDKCIGCGKCIDACPTKALRMPEGGDMHTVFCERLVEYAKAVKKDHDMVYINVLVDISTSCDCSGHPGKPFVPNIGILASTDMVAIEKASHDLVSIAHNCDDPFQKVIDASGKRQIEYAYELKMGNKNYRLVDLDKNTSKIVKSQY
ncbi:4Fe-4S ferredoxin [Bacteroidia bacterium]|nr:4Fe-4S ferredoxin [Bacteroidia bacterium]